jgi:DNA-binding IclR family transcriptional regulator
MSSDKPSDTDKKTTENVRAVQRALDILLAFTRGEPVLTAAQLLQRVALSRPTLYRLLSTLEQQGFVASSGEPQKFRLGPSVAKLSYVWTESLDLTLIAQPIMQRLWEQTRETVAIFVPQGDQRFCLAELPSPQPLNFKRGTGYTERIAKGASGRAILAHTEFTEADLARYLKDTGLKPKPFKQRLAETRQLGYAVSRDELIEGAVAVAAPFFGLTGVAGSIGIFGPATRLGDTRVKVLGRMASDAADSLSALLGVPTSGLAARL